MIKLLNLYTEDGIRTGAIEFLYSLMQERAPETNISHKELPPMADHVRFVESRPYRLWSIIAHEEDDAWLGYVSATHSNEIGIIVRKQFQGSGVGPAAIRLFMSEHQPNPHRASLCNGKWLANIAPANKHSQHVFEKIGFRKIQETFALEETDGNQAEAKAKDQSAV